MKKLLSILIALAFVLSLIPVSAFAKTEAPEKPEQPAAERGVNTNVVIDTDASGGYEGDYVVIYNPSSSTTTGASTGSLTGLIDTTIMPNQKPTIREYIESRPDYNPDKPVIIDVDSEMSEFVPDEDLPVQEPGKATWNVGDTKNFTISNYSPGGSSIQFKVLYVGNHCRIWTVTNSSYHPLDAIDSSYASIAAAEFDQKFELMQVSYGNFKNVNGDGLVNIMFYNIDDGWQPGQGYVAGYFWQGDYQYNSLDMIHIDTYPGIQYTNGSGQTITHLDDCYGTLVHEFQHCINYNVTGGMHSWLNESFSGSAEELCYPGSGLFSRIQSWHCYQWTSSSELYDPPKEYAYNSSVKLNKGGSLAYWNNNDDMDDLLNRYAGVMFFSQFLYSKAGTTTVYKNIIDRCSGSSVSNSLSALQNGTGWSLETIWRDYAISLVANDYESGYGFRMNDGYDPSEYYDLETLYSLLSPVVYNSTSAASVQGGGFIVIKPLNGVYNPPSGASSTLKYAGITLNAYNVTAVSNNNAYGTVSVNGKIITASPASGCYVESVEVIEGTATYTVNGNTITVAPTSDCTIRVNFAPKPTYTVNFVASGTAEGAVSALIYDVITLPSAVSVNPEGWTFCGWMTEQLEETTDRPEFYAPGASYTVTDSTTLFALYTQDTGEGETVYELVTEDASNWAGNYVITSGKDTNLIAFKGVGSAQQLENSSCGASVEYASTGMYLNGTTLKSVSSDYVFTIAKKNTNYTIKSPTNFWISTQNTYLYNLASYTSNYSDWGITYDTSYSCMKIANVASTTYTYLVVGSYGYFVVNNTYTANKTYLWKETASSVSYYTTDPVAPVQTYSVVFYDYDGSILKEEQMVNYGGDAIPPANPTREGYTFAGWSPDYHNVQSDLSVYAQYTVNSYTLTIYYVFENGETAAETYTGTFAFNAEFSVASPEIYGYYADQTLITGNMPADDLEFTVTYNPESFTVTFYDMWGQELGTSTVPYNTAATAPDIPEREGYHFVGWDKDFSHVTEDMDVYAIYEVNTYTLTINYVFENGDTAAEPFTGSYEFGEAYSVTSPKINGYMPDQAVVEGTMGAGDYTVTVVYSGMRGDVDLDGEITIADALLCMRHAMHIVTLENQLQLYNADFTEDTLINTVDALQIMRYALLHDNPNALLTK